MTEAGQAPDTRSGPTAAGLYDAYLGGNHGTLADKEAAARLRAVMPELEETAWANRAFHQRAARWLVTEAGIRQFIDIGSGLPTQDNTHQVVQRLAPDAHVVYVEIDPSTVQQGRALIEGDPNTRFVHADMKKVDEVMSSPEIAELIDLSQPVGLLASAVFHFVADEEDPWGIAKRYMDLLPSGSYIALTHITADKQPPAPVQTIYSIYRNADTMIYFRNREQTEWFFDGLELVEPYEGAGPKVTFMGYWGCEDPAAADDDSSRWCYCGVAKKP